MILNKCCKVHINNIFITWTANSKQKKIRFIDDASRNPDEEEKDTRLKFARPKPAGVTPLQAKMLKLAGQQAPIKEKKEARHF